MSLKTRLEASMKELRRRVSQRLPMDNAWLIRIRAAYNIGEFMLAHPRDPLSNSIGVRRSPGFRRLHIFFRHVHIRHTGRSRDPEKLRPEWFSHERCLASLLTTLAQSPIADRVSLTVVYDGTEGEFDTDFVSEAIRKPSKMQLGVKLVNGGSNIKSWLELLTHIEHSDIPDDDVLFLMENDYVYIEGWLDKVAELFESEHQFDYVTLYDHTDYYDLDGKPRFPAYKGLKSNLFVTKTHHWREAPSTCGTFLVPKRIFVEDLEVWSSRLSDFYVFTYLRAVKRRVLLSPVPGLSTHCMEGYLAPTIDWSAR